MRHFARTKVRDGKNNRVEIYPALVNKCDDLMTKGGKFYAVLDRETGMWSKSITDVISMVDKDLYSYRDEHYTQDAHGIYRDDRGREVVVISLDDNDTRKWKEFRDWVSNLPTNNAYVPLDSDITFIDEKVKPEQYRSKRLSYKIEKGDISNYEKLMNTTYNAENRQKIEWCFGAIFTGHAKKIQKIAVLHGKPGTGKSTVLKNAKKLFKDYCDVINVNDVVDKTKQFGTAAFRNNALLGIQDDCDLSKIEDASIFNSIVSHEEIIINEKHLRQYPMVINTFLMVGTNDIVDIRDTTRGMVRRLIDIYPTGNTLPIKEYDTCMSRINYELGGIAYHCIEVFNKLGAEYYNNYIPTEMINKSNVMRNFIFDKYDELVRNDPISRNVAFEWYKAYFEESGFGYPPKRIEFGEHLKEYYSEYHEIKNINGKTVRHVYEGFKSNMFDIGDIQIDNIKEEEPDWLTFTKSNGKYDIDHADCLAQYTKGADETPKTYWSKVTTTLKDIDTSKVHYLKFNDIQEIIIDFDLKDGDKKSLKKNIEEASKWPPTYAELSKSGEGIHLHYFYTGDVEELDPYYSDKVEVKVYSKGSALRRKLTKCNNLDIATISSGLPLKGATKKMLSDIDIKNEKELIQKIKAHLQKKIAPSKSTKQSMSMLYADVEKAYESGVHYDITSLKSSIFAFANSSTNSKDYCRNLYRKMHYQSQDIAEYVDSEFDELMFFDLEVLPNKIVICYGLDSNDIVLNYVDPSPMDVDNLIKYKLIGFNNKVYDNNILHAIKMGYSIKEVYELSRSIIAGGKGFAEARNYSYTDIFDFASAKNKKSLNGGRTH